MTAATEAVAFVDVTVVPMTSDATLPARTVIVQGGTITAIVPATDPIPANVTVIRASGHFLAPALIDGHVHLRRAELAAYPRAGIATVRNMWGYQALAARVDSITSGFLLGPDVYSVSSGIDASPPNWPETQFVDSPDQAESIVQLQADRGYRQLKIYQKLSLASFDAIVAAAQSRGLGFLGHVPSAVDVRHAIAAGMFSIEHLTGYDRAVTGGSSFGTFAWANADPSRYPALITTTVAANVWNVPTLAIQDDILGNASNAAAARTNLYRFVRELAAAGGKIAAGSDAGIDRTPAGTGLHLELDQLVEAGLTRYQALAAATVDAAQLIGMPNRGTIVVGADAALVLLPGNPLENLGVLGRIDGIVLRGRWLSKRALAQ